MPYVCEFEQIFYFNILFTSAANIVVVNVVVVLPVIHLQMSAFCRRWRPMTTTALPLLTAATIAVVVVAVTA